MVVHVHKAQLDYFRHLARNSPKEILAYLMGTMTESMCRVSYFAYPALNRQSSETVRACEKSSKEIIERAEEKGLVLLGDVHSHPQWWPVKSKADHKAQLTECSRLCGVCAVMDRKTKVYFWVAESSLPATLLYY